MATERANRSLNLSDEEEALFREAMRIEHIEGLGPWIRRAAILYAKQVIDGEALRSEEMADLTAEIRSLKRQLSRVSDSLNATSGDNDDTLEHSKTGKHRHG